MLVGLLSHPRTDVQQFPQKSRRFSNDENLTMSGKGFRSSGCLVVACSPCLVRVCPASQVLRYPLVPWLDQRPRSQGTTREPGDQGTRVPEYHGLPGYQGTMDHGDQGVRLPAHQGTRALSPNDHDSKNRIKIMCKNPVRMPRHVFSRPDILRKSWNHILESYNLGQNVNLKNRGPSATANP